MILLQLLFFCFLPPALWIAYCLFAGYFSFMSAFRVLFYGLGAVLAAAALQWALDPVTRRLAGPALALFTAFIEAALIEETVKLTMLNGLPELRRPHNGSTSGIGGRALLAFAILIGLSFSSFETVMYSLLNPSITALRFLTALPVHVGATVFSGVALLRFRSGRSLFASVGVVSAGIILHGVFNLCLGFRGFPVYGSFLSILVFVGFSLAAWYRAGGEADQGTVA